MGKLRNPFTNLAIKSKTEDIRKKNKGYCQICESETVFVENNSWLRDYYLCERCHSIPRQRAIINVLNKVYPNWRDLKVHESSPGGQSSDYINEKCKKYSFSHFFPDVTLGDTYNGCRCENVENMTFPDQEFDLFITQDVFEHIMNPELAFKEIWRVLKPGGAHVFTIPWYPSMPKTVKRAKINNNNNEIQHLESPVYHGNPINEKGSLVTHDWGVDLPDFIYEHSGMHTMVYLQIDRNLGLDAEFLEVFISRKGCF